MFYEGSLQTGISTAVDQQKLVFCFVTNDNDESKTWENEYLQDESLNELIKTQAVALRLEAGSEEAGYLSQIIPLPQTPTIVIMKHGELKEYVAAGTSKDDFIRRVQNTFGGSSNRPSSSSAAPSTPVPATTAPAAGASTSEPSPSAPTGETDRSDSVRRVLAERAARLQTQKELAEQKAREDRAKAKEKQDKAIESDPVRAGEKAELKKRRLQESDNRKRILKRIEDDKAERKLRAAEREQQREHQRLDSPAAEEAASSPIDGTPKKSTSGASRVGAMTALQVRLFDGSTIRSRFKTDTSVKEVRSWVDDSRGRERQPYTFKQVLTPLPNKAIDATEEDKTLVELGLAPSATLVLVPVQTFASAYAGRNGGIVSSIWSIIIGILGWFLGLLGLAGSSEAAQHGAPPAEGSDDAAAINLARARAIQGFQNPDDRRRDQQLYNGNSLNFEPRPDEEDK